MPLPEEIAGNKDLSVDPGDSFYDYCNGTWLKNNPIPATGSSGGIYDQSGAMEQRVKQLASEVPAIGRFIELREAKSGQPEATKVYLDALKARFPKPKTKEEAFITMGKMMAEGINLWQNPLVPTWNMVWKEGRLLGTITPYIDLIPNLPDIPKELDPAQFVPLLSTKAGEAQSAESLIVKGLGEDPSLFVSNPQWNLYWEKMEARSLDELCSLIDDAWDYYE